MLQEQEKGEVTQTTSKRHQEVGFLITDVQHQETFGRSTALKPYQENMEGGRARGGSGRDFI